MNLNVGVCAFVYLCEYKHDKGDCYLYHFLLGDEKGNLFLRTPLLKSHTYKLKSLSSLPDLSHYTSLIYSVLKSVSFEVFLSAYLLICLHCISY